jgi:hypothetical protein
MTKKHGNIDQNHQESAKSLNVKTFIQSLPCKGISKLILTGISIILTVIVSYSMDIKKSSEQPDQYSLYHHLYQLFHLWPLGYSHLLHEERHLHQEHWFIQPYDCFSCKVFGFLCRQWREKVKSGQFLYIDSNPGLLDELSVDDDLQQLHDHLLNDHVDHDTGGMAEE